MKNQTIEITSAMIDELANRLIEAKLSEVPVPRTVAQAEELAAQGVDLAIEDGKVVVK